MRKKNRLVGLYRGSYYPGGYIGDYGKLLHGSLLANQYNGMSEGS